MLMARYLRYFTTVGDVQHAELEEEELHVASEELSQATGQFPTTLTFRDSLKRLYSSDRFQVWYHGSSYTESNIHPSIHDCHCEVFSFLVTSNSLETKTSRSRKSQTVVAQRFLYRAA